MIFTFSKIRKDMHKRMLGAMVSCNIMSISYIQNNRISSDTVILELFGFKALAKHHRPNVLNSRKTSAPPPSPLPRRRGRQVPEALRSCRHREPEGKVSGGCTGCREGTRRRNSSALSSEGLKGWSEPPRFCPPASELQPPRRR